MGIYLFLKHNDVRGSIKGVLQKYQHTVAIRLEQKRRTLAGQILIQRLLHSGLGRRKGR